ncbi:alpha/beta hydrolase [Alteraurantiacibacter aquimixticola]|uniref:Alpha/beta hydrolase n=1 Tax=Alteraurantiacibacter aquimixticola TaxID=2489173 RepID=A0A4T3EWS1_9SPHN|nr:alpha/beta hydrolase [Alteraurantiacibacter aquimixticola]TIX49006.1 alpha/beta hydrolase [Alteraurantiacibacter aquimixticola]
MTGTDTQFAEIAGRRIAYRHTPGSGPAIVFLPGYMSDMAGGKATAVFDWCVAAGRECLLLDYSGCGESPGDFADGTLSRWCEEVVGLADEVLANERIVIVGSSMGGWLMLLAARELGDRIAGLVGIASAPDFTSWGYDKDQKAALKRGETVYEESDYGYDPMPTHPAFWADGQAQRQLKSEIPLDCPVRLLHGQEDADVPPQTSLDLSDALRSEDVQVVLVKGGDHRLSRDSDIALLLRTMASIH